MAATEAPRTTHVRQILLAVLAAVWLAGGTYFIVHLESRDISSGESRTTTWWQLGVLLLQMLIAVSSTAVLVWTRSRRQTEKLERQRAEEFRQLFYDGTEAMFVADSALVVLEWNDAGESLTGFSRAERVGRSVLELIDPVDLAARPPKLADLRAGKRLESDRLLLRRDGKRISVEFSIQLLPDGRILGVARDVSKRREVEQRLRLLSRALEESPAAMVITDPGGQIVYVNPRFASVTGWTAAEAIGRTPAILSSGQTAPATYRELWESILAGREWRGELVNRRKNGELFPWLLSVHPITDGQGKIEHFLGVGEDASERRAAERTLEETRAELFQAQKMEALGRLAGGVAHDFNNLLGVILGYSDLLFETLPRDSEGRDQLGEVRKAVLRASDLTRQLLAFSRRQVLAVRQVDLASLLEDSRKMLSRLLPENIELRLDIQPGLWQVRADTTQLVQVLINLAVNSRDALPLGGRISVLAANVEFDEAGGREQGLAPGSYVRLEVRDTGAGMTPDILAHAFEPFYTTKSTTGGTGLGLATVYGIVQQMGGSATIESMPSRGTTVAIWLPRSRERASEEVAVAPELLAKRVQSTILVVEDLAPLRKLVERMLVQSGYRVYAAGSPKEALAIVGEEGVEIDLLLSDIVMPGMDGRDLARLLRVARPGMRVVLMTGYSDLFADLKDISELGADAVMQKPFSHSEMERTLAKVLAGSEVAGQGC